MAKEAYSCDWTIAALIFGRGAAGGVADGVVSAFNYNNGF
jgi:hypothetical protein